jgi:hypothetical protein
MSSGDGWQWSHQLPQEKYGWQRFRIDMDRIPFEKDTPRKFCIF